MLQLQRGAHLGCHPARTYTWAKDTAAAAWLFCFPHVGHDVTLPAVHLQQTLKVAAERRSTPPPQQAAHIGSATHAARRRAMLQRVLELNCFSEQDEDPGGALGRRLAAAQTAMGGSQAMEVLGGAAVEERVRGTASSGGWQSTDPSTLPTCEFLAWVMCAQAQCSTARHDVWGGEVGAGQGDAGANASSAHLGLWVEHAWMNHSCAPNVVNYVLGRAMVRVVICVGRAGEGSYSSSAE